MRIEKLNVEIDRARSKVTEWQARLKDLERQKTEQENLEILQVVRGVAASPEEIRDILDLIRSAKEPPQAVAAAHPNTTILKEEPPHETE